MPELVLVRARVPSFVERDPEPPPCAHAPSPSHSTEDLRLEGLGVAMLEMQLDTRESHELGYGSLKGLTAARRWYVRANTVVWW